VDEMIESGRGSALHPVSILVIYGLEILSKYKLQKDVTQ
jgi:hypothetical protein